MAEDAVTTFPASEIWGLNRRRPCLIVLSDRKLVIMEGPGSGRARIRPPRVRTAADLESQDYGKRYSLSLERIRWVEVDRHFTGCVVRILTVGGSYRFRMRRRPARRLENRLRDLLGDRVRNPEE